MKSYIEQHGWWQGSMCDYDEFEGGNSTPPACLVGAYKFSVLNGRFLLTDTPCFDAIRDYIGQREIGLWNDQKGRTKEEVLELLENVAIKHEPDVMEVKHDG